MATIADLEARVRGLESRGQRADEDITAIISTVVETRDDVKKLKDDVKWLKDDVNWLKRAAKAQLDHAGIRVDDTVEDEG